LLGPNGAGKSSTIGIIASLVTKTAGKVKIFDIDTDENFPEAKRLLGVVSQEINFNNFEKVMDIVTTQAGFYGIPLKEAKEKTEITLKASWPLGKKMSKLEIYLVVLKEAYDCKGSNS